jgi:hypothetical protein
VSPIFRDVVGVERSPLEYTLFKALRLLLQEVKADNQALACIDERIIKRSEDAIEFGTELGIVPWKEPIS